jgi:hypothetical protein
LGEARRFWPRLVGEALFLPARGLSVALLLMALVYRMAAWTN